MKSLILILFTAFFGGFTLNNSSFEITGTIYNSSGTNRLSNVSIKVKGTSIDTRTDQNGHYRLTVPSEQSILVASSKEYLTEEILVGKKRVIDFYLKAKALAEAEVADQASVMSDRALRKASSNHHLNYAAAMVSPEHNIQHNTEEYAAIEENIFHQPTNKPFSTFSIDVDAASYSNVRRFLQQGQHPPKDAVRIEEMINYFTYDYPQPQDNHPFSVSTELSQAPWNPDHQLVHIGLQGENISMENLPPSNLVFLIDVSGSMRSPNKLGLLKSAFKLLTNQLRAVDKVSIVVYAGAAGVVLEPTSGNQKQTIVESLAQLQAGGSTAGGEGIKLAYQLARKHLVEGGNNRIILATDGDFNIGESSNAAMERLIEKEREHGIFLTVLGFGMGNYKDSKMEILADKGNGNYAYIDNILEAKKVLVNEFGGTLFTIAKDVKLQIEFNPEFVKAYRLIGYENRKLKDEDFNDDKKDAGELGSGHSVTALYEIIPANVAESPYLREVDKLKYQSNGSATVGEFSDEMMTVKLRYKQPNGEVSRLITKVMNHNPSDLEATTDNFRWSAAVASFGMLLRDSEFKGQANYSQVEQLARNSLGDDPNGYRAEFLKLLQSVELLAQH